MLAGVLLASKAIFAAVGLAAGIRLLRTARGGGGVAAHAWLGGLVLLGGLGLVGFGVAPSLAEASEPLARWLMILGDGLERIALLTLAMFVYRVFGRGRPGRALALCVSWIVILSSWLASLTTQQWPLHPTPPGVEAFGQLAFATPFLWSTLESWLEFRRSQRQLRLGLTDAMVTHRFLLWSMACGFFTLVTLLSALAALVPDGGGAAVFLSLSRSLFYVAIAGVVTLGLFPPALYVRWVTSDGDAVAAD